ncbi:unnamed protein product [Hermetia illucens]|uniref:Uncharacterized protein n=1 Tax=Hermetia illucens TaxID=343691 RepID=A0A7R8YQE6_HERIL|nr:unnamed protein product [Hermetia illucens]
MAREAMHSVIYSWINRENRFDVCGRPKRKGGGERERPAAACERTRRSSDKAKRKVNRGEPEEGNGVSSGDSDSRATAAEKDLCRLRGRVSGGLRA